MRVSMRFFCAVAFVLAVICAGEALANKQRVQIPDEVSVRVPKIVRKDLVAKAVDFCHKLYPKTPKRWFEDRLAPYLEAESWKVKHLSLNPGHVGPIVGLKLKGRVVIDLSFPDASPLRRVRGNYRANAIPGGKEEKVTLAQAMEKSKSAFSRLFPDEKQRKAYKLVEKREIHDRYRMRWESPVGPQHKDCNSLDVWIYAKTGRLFSCWLSEVAVRPSKTPIVPREQIEAKIRGLHGKVKPEHLGLFLWHYMGERILCWHYELPAPPEGLHGITAWDAYTGELLYSNEFDKEGKELDRRGWYRNPKYFPYRTEKQIRARLEEVARRRAKELEAKQKAEKEQTTDKAPKPSK